MLLFVVTVAAAPPTTHLVPEVCVCGRRGEVVGCRLADLWLLRSEQAGQGPEGAVSGPELGRRHLLQLGQTQAGVPAVQGLHEHTWASIRQTEFIMR